MHERNNTLIALSGRVVPQANLITLKQLESVSANIEELAKLDH